MFGAKGQVKSKVFALVLAPLMSVGGMAATPSSVAAATGVGSYTISVTCDSLARSLDFGVTVGPTPGFTKQRIYFQFAMWDDTRNQQVTGYWPGAWLYLDYQMYFPNGRIENSISSPTWRINLPAGRYRVWAQFQYAQTATTGWPTGWVQATVRNYGGGFSSTCNL